MCASSKVWWGNELLYILCLVLIGCMWRQYCELIDINCYWVLLDVISCDMIRVFWLYLVTTTFARLLVVLNQVNLYFHLWDGQTGDWNTHSILVCVPKETVLGFLFTILMSKKFHYVYMNFRCLSDHKKLDKLHEMIEFENIFTAAEHHYIHMYLT